MAGTKASWTPERRAARAELTRRQMADPARRERQREIMKRVRSDPANEAKRHARRYTEENREKDSRRLARLHQDPAFVAKKIAGVIAAVKGKPAPHSDPTKARAVREAKARGGDIPQGYEGRYRELRSKHGHRETRMKASDALFLVELEKIRNDPVPAGYADTYDYLLNTLGVSAEQAKEIVHQQRALDPRG
jgi:hypothetical protein